MPKLKSSILEWFGFSDDMIPASQFDRGWFLWFALLCASTHAIAQPFGYPRCEEPDIQTSLHFYQAPHGDQVVAVEYHNIGSWTCVLAPFDTNSEKGIHLGGYFIPVEIAKGNTIHSSFRWHAADSEPGIHCDPLYTLPFLSTTLRNPLPVVGAWILVPSACSQLKQTPYLPGLFVPDWQPSGGTEKPLPSAPIVSVDKDTYYGFEPIDLHVKLTDQSAPGVPCPYLVLKSVDAYGNTDLREVGPAGCHRAPPAPWIRPGEFDVQAGTSFIGENTFIIEQVADPNPYGELRLVPSNSVSVKVLPAPRACMPDDLEPTLHFYRPSIDQEVVSLDYRNISDTVCMIAPVEVKGGVSQSSPSMAILPGQTVHTAHRWNVNDEALEASSNRCQQGGLNFWVYQPSPSVAIDSRTLLSNACASWTSEGYQPGPFVPDWKTDGARSSPAAAPVLIAPKTTYDDGENVELRVRPETPTAPGGKCPVLFQTVRDSAGTVLWEITNPRVVNSANGCVAQSSWGGKWWGPKDEYPIELRVNGVLGQITLGKRIVTVSELEGIGPDGELRLESSEPIALTVVDPATIPRSWGKTEDGLKADLTLDNLTYTVGQDVPLHLAFEDVSATRPLYSVPLNGGLCPSDFTVSVEKEDGSHPEFFKLPGLMITEAVCVAGYRRKPLVQGKILAVEDTLYHLGLLPSQPGVYRITVSWRSYENPSFVGGQANLNEQKPYVTVTSAPTTLRIVPSEASN